MNNIQQEICNLQNELIDIATREGKIRSRINEIQKNCPHENKINRSVHDVYEFKTRSFCSDCGFEL